MNRPATSGIQACCTCLAHKTSSWMPMPGCKWLAHNSCRDDTSKLYKEYWRQARHFTEIVSPWGMMCWSILEQQFGIQPLFTSPSRQRMIFCQWSAHIVEMTTTIATLNFECSRWGQTDLAQLAPSMVEHRNQTPPRGAWKSLMLQSARGKVNLKHCDAAVLTYRCKTRYQVFCNWWDGKRPILKEHDAQIWFVGPTKSGNSSLFSCIRKR